MKKKNGELSLRVLSNGPDITNTLMSDEVGKLAGEISAFAQIRKALVERQRRFREPPGLVAEGRDMGTSIFPDAFLKIFLTADLNVRAERRLAQLLSMGHKDATIESVLNAMCSRDQGDITRASSPLKKAKDAIEVDTTNTTAEQTARQIADRARSKLGAIYKYKP